MSDFWFIVHFIASLVAFTLIIILDMQCILRRILCGKPEKGKKSLNTLKYHKEMSFVMLASGVISLIASFSYGFGMDFDFSDVFNLHYWFGFGSLIFSLLPFLVIYVFKKTSWHNTIAYISGILVVLAIVTGFIAYTPRLAVFFDSLVISAFESLNPSNVSETCITLEQLNSSETCLVSVDNIVHDMTAMPRWGSRKHFDYLCGGNYTLEYIVSIVPTHSNTKYYGPVAGELCTE